MPFNSSPLSLFDQFTFFEIKTNKAKLMIVLIHKLMSPYGNDQPCGGGPPGGGALGGG